MQFTESARAQPLECARAVHNILSVLFRATDLLTYIRARHIWIYYAATPVGERPARGIYSIMVGKSEAGVCDHHRDTRGLCKENRKVSAWIIRISTRFSFLYVQIWPHRTTDPSVLEISIKYETSILAHFWI